MKEDQSLLVLGVMTGTSCDGLDAACIEIDASGWSPIWSSSSSYPKNLRAEVLQAQKPGEKKTIQEWMELHRDLGNWYAGTLAKIIDEAEVKPDVIANHGQTVAHFPQSGMTLQLGEPTRIAALTGLSVVSQFRDGDLAVGGQGAPLVPSFHRVLASQIDPDQKGIAIHNLGGISNLTYIGPDDKILAFDTGPGNIWIDLAAEKATLGKLKMDTGGRLAAKGVVDHSVVKKLLKHPFFSKAPPKSTGRDDFTAKVFFSAARGKGTSLVATATAVTVESIARAYEKWILKKLPLHAIYFCGGGAQNPTLIQGIRERLASVQVLQLSDVGLDEQLIEAQAFAFLGFLSLLGQPLGGSWTGVNSFGPPGHIIPGKNWSEVLNKLGSIRSS